jgi:hypothetical protein
MDYICRYLNKFFNLGVEKAMRHHKLNDEINWDPELVWSVLSRSKTGPDPYQWNVAMMVETRTDSDRQ